MNLSIRKHLARSLILGLLVLALGTCSIVVTTPSYIRISNASSIYTLAHVYIAAHVSSVWGSDKLYPNVLTPGSSASFQVNPGYYDVLVTDTTPWDAYAYNVEAASGTVANLYFDGIDLAP